MAYVLVDVGTSVNCVTGIDNELIESHNPRMRFVVSKLWVEGNWTGIDRQTVSQSGSQSDTNNGDNRQGHSIALAHKVTCICTWDHNNAKKWINELGFCLPSLSVNTILFVFCMSMVALIHNSLLLLLDNSQRCL